MFEVLVRDGPHADSSWCSEVVELLLSDTAQTICAQNSSLGWNVLIIGYLHSGSNALFSAQVVNGENDTYSLRLYVMSSGMAFQTSNFGQLTSVMLSCTLAELLAGWNPPSF